MFLVGLTGGIATGKSTVANMLKDFHCPIVDADLAAREVVRPGMKAWKKIKQHFGDEVFQYDGELNRAKLGEIIFADPEKRKLLCSITHPEIYKVMVWEVFQYFFSGESYVILDLPLLFETGQMLPFMSKIIVVSCDQDTQLQRLMLRNNFTEEEAQSRISSQMALSLKRRQATYVVDNSGTLNETRAQVEHIYKELKSSRLHWSFRFVVLLSMVGLFSLCWYFVNWVVS